MRILIVLAVLLSFFLTISTLLYNPKIWPDEAYLADIAYNFINHGKLVTMLWGEMFTGVKEHIFWYPPLYFYLLSLSFKIFGFSIVTQRLLSIFMGVCFIFVLFALFGKIAKKPTLLALSILGFLVFDEVFLRGAKIGRPEIMVLLLGSISFLIYELKDAKNRQACLSAGLLSGLATITHLWGVMFFVSIFVDSLLKRQIKTVKFLLIGFLIPVLFWLISIYPNYHIFLEQLSLQTQFRTVIKSHLVFTFWQNNLEYKAILSLYIILTAVIIVSALKIKKYLYLCLVILIGWVIYIWGDLEWYMIYFVPFIYLLTSLVINHFSRVKNIRSKSLSIFIVLLMLALLSLNIKSYFKSLAEYGQYQDSYNQLLKKVTGHIPQESVVYLSSIPDLYFSLKDKYQLYEFPGLYPKLDKFIEVLDKSDFVIINYHLERMLVGQLLIRYLQLNTTEEFAFIYPGDNSISIIKLKPQSERVNP